MKLKNFYRALLLSTAASTAAAPALAYTECDWNDPGADKYTGSPADAVNSYKDIPWIHRHLLSSKVGKAASSVDQVEIYKDGIVGRNFRYSPLVMDMHFGSVGRVCGNVSRVGWLKFHHEPAAVYCVGEFCVAVPTVCGNVFRLNKTGVVASASGRVSEPSSLWLTLVGLAGFAVVAIRKRKR